MFAIEIPRRNNWQKRIKEVGYLADLFLDAKMPYWVEQLEKPFCYQFTSQEIDRIDKATQTVRELTLQLVNKIVTSTKYESYLQRLEIPQEFWEAIRVSWDRENPDDFELYGRFDGILIDDQFKILEYNADTPTFVCEFLHQWLWLEDMKRQKKLPEDADQFNSIDIALKKQFQFLAHQYGLLRRNPNKPEPLLHFTVMQDAPEDEDTVLFLMAMASEAGINSKLTYLEEIGFDENGCLVDQDNWIVTHLFKLYPWENIFKDEIVESRTSGKFPFRDAILIGNTKFIEPAWKALLSNKGIWVFMYEEFRECPFLLVSYFSDDLSTEAIQLRNRVHVEKPLISREGANIRISDPDPRIGDLCKRSGPYNGSTIIQEFFASSEFNGYYPAIGSWYIGEPCGIGIRADKSLITGNRSLFVPHYIGDLVL